MLSTLQKKMSFLSWCGCLCESYELQAQRDKQIADWQGVLSCRTEHLEFGKMYNGRITKVLNEKTVEVLIKHTNRFQTYRMQIYDFLPFERNKCKQLLQQISDDIFGICSVFIVQEHKELQLFNVMIRDRYNKDIRHRLIDNGITIETTIRDPSVYIPSPAFDSDLDMTLKRSRTDNPPKELQIIQKSNTMPIIMDENGVPDVVNREEIEPEHEVIQKEMTIPPVELLRKSITLPYIVQPDLEIKEEPLKKMPTIPYIVHPEEVEIKEEPLRKTITIPYIIEPHVI